VVVYTSVDQVYSEPVIRAFEKRTGILVLPVYDVEASKTTGLVNRLIAERGRPQADVFWKSYTVDDGLPHMAVRMIRQAADGSVWVATGFARQGGVARYQDGVWTNLTKQNGLAGESTRSVYQDRAGRMWIGSEYDGIAVLENGTWTVLSEKNGLAGNEVKILDQDQDGAYWLGTAKGLTRITRY